MIISVGSFEEAKNYPVMFGTTELMMNATDDIFYTKAVDSMGKYTMGTYRFTQVENEKPFSAENFVTRDQFNALDSKIDFIIKELGGATNGE